MTTTVQEYELERPVAPPRVADLVMFAMDEAGAIAHEGNGRGLRLEQTAPGGPLNAVYLVADTPVLSLPLQDLLGRRVYGARVVELVMLAIRQAMVDRMLDGDADLVAKVNEMASSDSTERESMKVDADDTGTVIVS